MFGMPCRLVAGLFIGILLACPAPAQEARKKPLAIEDLYLMESVGSSALFPGEEKRVYERVWIDPKSKSERHALWLVSGKRDNRRLLEMDEPDGRNPVVSPDGAWIAFLSTRPGAFSRLPMPSAPAYSDAAVNIWLYHVKSERVIPLAGVDPPWARVFHDGFYGRVAFSPDSKQVLFVADDGGNPRTKEEIANDVKIVRPDQGEGYTGYGPAQIWIATLDSSPNAANVTRLTNDTIWYGDPQWSPDGKSLIVVANKSSDRESVRFNINKNFDLFIIDIATKKQTQLTTNAGPDVSPRWAADGKRIVYLSSPRNGPHRDAFDLNMLVLDNGPTKVQKLLAHDTPIGKTGHYCLSYPLPQNPWGDSKTLRFNFDSGTATSMAQLDVNTRELANGIPGSAEKTTANRASFWPLPVPVLEQRLRSEWSIVSWQNEGLDLEGIFTAPPDTMARPPYKLIVYPHGGPHSRSTTGFDFTVQLFAAHGYAVFQPNFRGSSGYGKKFIDADRFDLGGGDMRDILTGIDKLVSEGKVDAKRQFVYGISYGGFMTSWLVGHTNRFRAAAAQNAVTDMNMMFGLGDLQSWTTWELGGTPWEQPERYRKHSPITYADRIKTPTLILHSRDDRRCPLPMGKAFHQALLANNVSTEIVIYPNEGHGIRAPRHREDVYRRVLAWFAKFDGQ